MIAWSLNLSTVIWHPFMVPLMVSGLAGLVAYVFARRGPLISCAMSIVASIVALVMTIDIFSSPADTLTYPFVEMHGLQLALVMASGSLSSLIAMGCAFFGLMVAVYAAATERGRPSEGRFHAFLCWTLTGAIGAALADDLVWLLVCWEIVSLCLYMMLSAGRPEGAPGAAKTFAMIGFGDAAMLLAIALIAATEGTTRISQLSITVGAPLTYICYLLFMAAALAKAGAIPFHSWIPTAAQHASASVFAFLPASLDKLLGIYLLARFSLDVFLLDSVMRSVLMVIGAITVIAAVLMAMMQHHLKTLLSYHAVSQVGYMVMGIGTGVPIGVIGGLFHMVNHAVYKSCLFLTAGTVERTTGTDDLNRLGGLARALPMTLVSSAIAALAISGVPPLNGFVSKWLVYQGCLAQGSPLAIACLIVAVFGSALTLASFFKVVTSVYWGPVSIQVTPSASIMRKLAGAAPPLVLASLCIAFGVAAIWPLREMIVPAVVSLEMPLDSLMLNDGRIQVESLGLWSPAPATILILLGVFGGLLFYLVGRVGQARETNIFVGGETTLRPESLKMAASGFYRTVEELPGIGRALQDGAQGAMDVYQLGGRYGGGIVSVLKAQHTGVLSMYVSWCLAGAVLIIAYLMIVLM